jgi:hypothetical protein
LELDDGEDSRLVNPLEPITQNGLARLDEEYDLPRTGLHLTRHEAEYRPG